MRDRAGKNAPTDAEREQVALLDRTRAVLFERAYTAEDICEGLGVPLTRFSHLRRNLQSYSFGQRQAAEALLRRFFALAMTVLESTPDGGSTAGALTLGKHLRRELARFREPYGSRGVMARNAQEKNTGRAPSAHGRVRWKLRRAHRAPASQAPPSSANESNLTSTGHALATGPE
jgi:hypothetical protein